MIFRAFLAFVFLVACCFAWIELSLKIDVANGAISFFNSSSLRVAKKRLDRCYSELNSARFLTSTDREYHMLLDGCTSTTRAVVQQFPTYSYGRVVSAFIANLNDDSENELVNLKLSFETSNAEAWIAKLRIEYVLRHRETLVDSPAFSFEIDRDIETLIRSKREWQTVARCFAREQLRTRILAIVQTLPVDDQSRFLSAMKTHLE